MNFKCVLSYIIIILCSYSIFAQDNSVVIKGRVTDSLQEAVTNATIIAKPKQEKAKIKYAISDGEGYYTLKLTKGIAYELNISHLGFNPINRAIIFSENNSNYNFELNFRDESLDEVVIDYKYEPIKKNKDTITYNLSAFTNGNEFKMKEVLDKLPGVKVEDNTIKVQGKTVTKLLVEGCYG